MKGKMKATLVVAVMVFSMASACFVSMSSEETSADTPSKVILGSELKPYYIDISGPGKEANIEFNESAFSDEAIVVFKDGNNIIPLKEQTAMNEKGVAVTITDADENSRDGCYKVKYVGTEDSKGGVVEVVITLSVTDKYDGKNLKEQLFEFVAYLIVENKTGRQIDIEGSNVTGTTTKSLLFNFEQNADVKLKVMTGDTPTSGGYVFYADGLPKGLSITRVSDEYVIGGKISSEYKTDNPPASNTVKIYAVSESGTVISKEYSWTIGSVPSVGSLVIMVGENVVDGYVSATDGDPFIKLTLGASSGFTLFNIKASVAGGNIIDVTDSELLLKFPSDSTGSTYSGTGVFNVVIDADISPESNGKTIHVTKTIEVFILSLIYDADLDPIVNSN